MTFGCSAPHPDQPLANSIAQAKGLPQTPVVNVDGKGKYGPSWYDGEKINIDMETLVASAGVKTLEAINIIKSFYLYHELLHASKDLAGQPCGQAGDKASTLPVSESGCCHLSIYASTCEALCQAIEILKNKPNPSAADQRDIKLLCRAYNWYRDQLGGNASQKGTQCDQAGFPASSPATTNQVPPCPSCT